LLIHHIQFTNYVELFMRAYIGPGQQGRFGPLQNSMCVVASTGPFRLVYRSCNSFIRCFEAYSPPRRGGMARQRRGGQFGKIKGMLV